MPVLKRDEPTKVNMDDDKIHTILGEDSSFEGKLVFNSGRVRIDGKFNGEIQTDNTLIIGEAAKVNANIKVGSVVITGEVNGDITAKHSVAIEKPGRLRGTIITPELMIEKGVLFEGTCKMDTSGSGGGKTSILSVAGDKKTPNGNAKAKQA